MDGWTDGQTDRRMEGQKDRGAGNTQELLWMIERQMDSQAIRERDETQTEREKLQPYWLTSYEKGKQAYRWVERQTKIITGIQKDRQRELQVDRKTDKENYR